MSDKERLEALARMIASELGEAANRPELRLVGSDKHRGPIGPQWTDVERESRIRWLRALRRHLKYMQVELFFEEALVGRRDLEDLSDEEIVELHRTIDRARDHYHNNDGVSYYEAGLLRRQEDVA